MAEPARTCALHFLLSRPGLPADQSRTAVLRNRLHIWETALKLKAQVDNPVSPQYAEALGDVLAHELVRLERGVSTTPMFKGGLAGRQKREISEFIEEHLDEEISLRQLADIVQLSRYHFARAFKHSFGMPPHRYHMSRRMERAKGLLQVPARTVTEVGMMLGFTETSSFTTCSAPPPLEGVGEGSDGRERPFARPETGVCTTPPRA
jgi:AraC-like DNA-binding protein